jgi:hypothetical protein
MTHLRKLLYFDPCGPHARPARAIVSRAPARSIGN